MSFKHAIEAEDIHSFLSAAAVRDASAIVEDDAAADDEKEAAASDEDKIEGKKGKFGQKLNV